MKISPAIVITTVKAAARFRRCAGGILLLLILSGAGISAPAPAAPRENCTGVPQKSFQSRRCRFVYPDSPEIDAWVKDTAASIDALIDSAAALLEIHSLKTGCPVAVSRNDSLITVTVYDSYPAEAALSSRKSHAGLPESLVTALVRGFIDHEFGVRPASDFIADGFWRFVVAALAARRENAPLKTGFSFENSASSDVPPLNRLLNNFYYNRFLDKTGDDPAASISFNRFLIERFGIDRYRQFYRSLKLNPVQNLFHNMIEILGGTNRSSIMFRRIYRLKIHEIESEWRQWLKNRPRER